MAARLSNARKGSAIAMNVCPSVSSISFQSPFLTAIDEFTERRAELLERLSR
jgi:hypothetical protein